MTDATREPRRWPWTRKRSGQEIARLLDGRNLRFRLCQRMRAHFRIFRGPASKYRIIRAGTRSRQQCRSGPQGPQEENATRGNLREMKLRGHYEKPSEKRAREKAEAVRRARKLARKKLQREGLLPMKPKPVPGPRGRPANPRGSMPRRHCRARLQRLAPVALGGRLSGGVFDLTLRIIEKGACPALAFGLDPDVRAR